MKIRVILLVMISVLISSCTHQFPKNNTENYYDSETPSKQLNDDKQNELQGITGKLLLEYDDYQNPLNYAWFDLKSQKLTQIELIDFPQEVITRGGIRSCLENTCAVSYRTMPPNIVDVIGIANIDNNKIKYIKTLQSIPESDYFMADIADLAISPEIISYSSEYKSSDGTRWERYRIFNVDLTGNVTKLSFDQFLEDQDHFVAAWSPDGTNLAFFVGGLVSTMPNIEYETNGLYISDRNGDNVSFLNSSFDRFSNIQWSPNNDAIASEVTFYSEDSLPIFNIGVIDLKTKQLKIIAEDEGADNSNPVWSPNGKYIAWETPVSGDINIWVMNNDGSNKGMVFRCTGCSIVSWHK